MSAKNQDGALPNHEDEKAHRDFHQAEYNSLRDEVVGIVARLDALTFWAPTAAGAVTAWVLSNGFGLQSNGAPCIKLPSVVLIVALFVPLFLALFAALASWLWYCRIEDFGNYLRRLERKLGCVDYGWESHPKNGIGARSENVSHEQSARPMFTGAAIYWTTLCLGLFILGGIGSVIAGMATNFACPLK